MAKKNKKSKNNPKIVRYRKPLNLNVGMIIFAIIFIYVIFSVSTYINKDQIQFYEVTEGRIVNDKEYSGIILRNEETHYTNRSGHVNYYIREGKRASVGTRIYSIDETGSVVSFLGKNLDTSNALSTENLSDVKKQLSAFSMAFEDDKFGTAYDVQYSLEASILEYINFNTMDSLDGLLEEAGANFQQVRAEKAGVISYVIDGYEEMKPADITAASFERSEYSREITKAGDLIGSDTPVYKTVTSDQWSIVFPLTVDDVAEYTGKERLKVKFSGSSLNAEGAFSIITGSDGNPYGKLDFKQYMIQFVSERFITFEIVSEQVEGLKIPATAVTTKNFYLVPLDYLTQGGNTSVTGFMKEIYLDGEVTVEFIPTELYYSNEEYYYIDMSENSVIRAGDYLVKPNSTERYQIGPSASLQGVYNINKGYAVFKQIDILKSNDEYLTIRKGTSYGLTVFDHIVLDATTTYEGALIYR